MTKFQQILLLLLLGITDAYMISHPNLLGKIGVRIYQYDMFKTFPAALLTVLGTIGIAYFIAEILQKKVKQKWAKNALILGLILSLAVLIQVYFKFSGGSYAHTGKVFKFGMHLFPILLIFVFANALWSWIISSRK